MAPAGEGAEADYRAEGNALFAQKKWREAIDKYTEGLEAAAAIGMPPDAQGLLLSNRSQCWLNLEEWQSAENDAEACLVLLPAHAKSLFRRATARAKLEKNEDALADFVKVVRLEPQNRAAVDEARRLKNEVMAATERKRDGVLPVHLLEVLRREDSSSDDKVDACNKVKALCFHKNCAKTLVQDGTVELLAEVAAAEHSTQELRAAALHALVVFASGAEARDDDEDEQRRKLIKPNEPLEVSPIVSEARRRLKEKLPLTDLRRRCRGAEACMRPLVHLVGFIFELEDELALETINDAVAFGTEPTEAGVPGDLPRAGVLALSTMCDARRRLGVQAKVVQATPIFRKCLESALNVTTCNDALQSLLAGAFALFADKEDRPKEQCVDLASVGHEILGPFLGSDDVALRANGLAGYAALLAADTKGAAGVLSQSAAPLGAILQALSSPEVSVHGRQAQDSASECLLLATGDLGTRGRLIENGAIDMILDTLRDGEEGASGVLRAKLIAVLAMFAGHNAVIREEIFDKLDFLLELRHASETARQKIDEARAASAKPQALSEARRLCKGLFESCTCLTIHGEFKELLIGAKKTLRSLQDLIGPEELAEDGHMSFLYAQFIYNLCRSRDDKTRPNKKEYPFNSLQDDDMDALEDFYAKMPAESRPAKNGEADPGSKELADQLRSWCIQQRSENATKDGGGGSVVVSHLKRCSESGSSRVKIAVAHVLKFLCAEAKNRSRVIAGGGIRALLNLADLEDEKAQDAARQALAQCCIVTNPQMFQYSEQLDAVRPLVQLLDNKHELLQFEGAMGLTNLLTASEELRSRCIQAKGWQAAKDLLFSDNEEVQRAGLELMCNMTMADEIIERFVTGKGDLEIKLLCAFCLSEDRASQAAASGALAMLAPYEEVAPKIAACESFGSVLKLLNDTIETKDAGLQHRAVACLCGVVHADGTPEDMKGQLRTALLGVRPLLVSREAESCIRAALEEERPQVNSGGA